MVTDTCVTQAGSCGSGLEHFGQHRQATGKEKKKIIEKRRASMTAYTGTVVHVEKGVYE